MAVAYVQNKGSQSASSSSLAEAFTSNVTAGNLLVGGQSMGGTAGVAGTTTPTDTLGHTYTATDIEISNGDGASTLNLRLWFVGNCSGGANTLTFKSVGAGEFTGEAVEFSGVSTSSPILDTHNSTKGTSSLATSPSITPTSSGALVVALMADNGGSTVVPTWSNLGTGATFTAVALSSVTTNGANQRMCLAYAIDTNAGTYQARATVNGGVSGAWCIDIAAFNAAAGGGAAAAVRRLGLMGAGH